MNKTQFIESLEEIVSDEILITDKLIFLEEEISKNCWSISANEGIVSQLEIEDIRTILKRIKSVRNQQLNHSKYEIDLIYYSWFDEQACQLRFNLINSNHKKLPFQSKTQFIENEDEIINDFLNSEYHDGIPFEELMEIDVDGIQEEKSFENEIKVYKELIKKRKTKA